MSILPPWVVNLVIAFLVLVAPSTLRRFDIGECWRESFKRAGLSLKEAAYYYGATPGDLDHALDGDKTAHLSEDRLTRLPDVVWLYHGVVVAEKLGRLESSETRAVHDLKRIGRMAKAESRREAREVKREEVA